MYINKKVTVAFVGSVVPDEQKYDTIAFSRAGNIAQQNIIRQLLENDLKPDVIYSYKSEPSFPLGKKVFVGSEKLFFESIVLKLVSYLNITPIKQLHIALNIILGLVIWRLQNVKTCKHLIYVFNMAVPPGIILVIFAKIFGCKIIGHINDIDVPGQTIKDSIWAKANYFFQRIAIRLLDGRILISDTIAKDFLTPCNDYIRIEGGLAEEVVSVLNTHTSVLPENFNVFFAGSLDEANGILIILEAFKNLLNSRFRLKIAGKGPLEKHIKMACEHDPRINYLGYINHTEVLDHYKSSNLLLNIRLTKTVNTKYFFPSKLLECMATGIPVLSTTIPGATEEIKEFIYLLKDETSECLRKRLEELINIDSNFHFKMGLNAKNYVVQNKTWAIQGKIIKKYVCQILLFNNA